MGELVLPCSGCSSLPLNTAMHEATDVFFSHSYLNLFFSPPLLTINLLVFILCQVSAITETGLFLLGELLINSMWLSLGLLSLDLFLLPTRSRTQGTALGLCPPTGWFKPLGFLCIE